MLQESYKVVAQVEGGYFIVLFYCPKEFICVLIGRWEPLVSAGTPPAPVCTNQEPRGRSFLLACDRNHKRPLAPRLSAQASGFGHT